MNFQIKITCQILKNLLKKLKIKTKILPFVADKVLHGPDNECLSHLRKYYIWSNLMYHQLEVQREEKEWDKTIKWKRVNKVFFENSYYLYLWFQLDFLNFCSEKKKTRIWIWNVKMKPLLRTVRKTQQKVK